MHTKVAAYKTLRAGSRFWQMLVLLVACALLLVAMDDASAQQAELYENINLSEDLKTRVKQYRENYTQAIEDRQFDEAETISTQAIALLQKAKESRLYLTLLAEHATLLQIAGKLADAEPFAREEIVLRRKIQGDRHPFTLKRISAYASLLERMDRLAEAEPLYVEVYTARKEVLGPKHRKTLKSLHSYAYVLKAMGRTKEAEPLYADVLRLRREDLGPNHPHTLSSMNNLASVLQTLGRVEEAEILYAEIFAEREKALGPKHPYTVASANSYVSQLAKKASELHQHGRVFEAEEARTKIFEIKKRILGERHPETLTALNKHAIALQSTGQFSKAEKGYAEALRLRKQVLGEKHLSTLDSSDNYATILIALNRPTEAEPLLEETLRMRKKIQGEIHADTLYTLVSYASMLELSGRVAEALPLYDRALRLRRQVLGDRHSRTIESLSRYGTALHRDGRTLEAEPLLAQALKLWRNTKGGGHPATRQSLSDYANLLISLDRWADAEPLVDDLVDQQKYIFGADHPKTLKALSFRARIFASTKRLVEAEALYNSIFESQELLLGDEHPATLRSQYDLANIRLQIPGLMHNAYEPIQAALSKIDSRRYETDFGVRDEIGMKRLTNDNQIFSRLFVDAAWAYGFGSEPESEASGAQQLSPAERKNITRKAFLALQNALTGATDKAIGKATALQIAETISPKLGILARRRQALFDDWEVQNTFYAKTLATGTAITGERKSTLRTAMKRIEADVKTINDQLRRDAPDYFAFVYPDALDLGDTETLLEENEAVLLLLPTDFGTHIMVASDEGIKWVRSDWKRDDINAAVKRLLWDVGATVEVSSLQQAEWSDQGEGAYPYDRKTAFALYNQIIAPVADRLKGKRHVFVTTTGSLGSLPLGILVSETPVGADGDPADLRATKWFADQHALVQIPSLQSLLKLRVTGRRAKNKNPPNSFIGFGDPVLQGLSATRGSNGSRSHGDTIGGIDGSAKSAFRGERTRSGTGVADIKALSKMTRLPGTALELEAMRSALKAPKTSLFMAAQASESNFRNTDLSGVNILTLATHGLLAGEIRGATEPGLVFTPPAKASRVDDGLLTTSEIAGLKLNADWVILSACNTAAGDGSEGAPGLTGLARSFFYAGARNLLASHWPVRDDVAAKITVRTIEIKRDNPELSRAEALQQAMQEIRNNNSADTENDTWAHPNAWAPFILIGDGG